MMYLRAIFGGAIAFVIFTAIALLSPGYGSTRETELILTVSTFLFAIIAGFFIARMNSRYDKIREVVSEEDSIMLSIFRTSQFFGKAFVNKVRELIDTYYITALDYDLGNYHKQTESVIKTIYSELNKLKMKGIKSQLAVDEMLDLLSSVEEKRNESSVMATEKLKMGQWAVLDILAGIIVFTVFYTKLPEFYSIVTTVLLSTILVLVILILRDLQNLRLGGEILLVESAEQVFEFMGNMRYYPKKFLDEGTIDIPDNVRKYRLGLHQPGEKFRIKVVDNR